MRLRHVVAACAALVAVAATSTVLAAAPPTSAGPQLPAEGPVPTAPDLPEVATDAGDVVIVAGANSDDPVLTGDTNTVFSVQLPPGSTCPGDSANDDWRVQTFIVPADTDLGTMRYGATRPQGDFMYALYTTEGRPYAQVLLAQNPAPGQPGQILGFPPLSFAPFTPDLLPVGRYRLGVACSYFETVERYWDAELELVEDTSVDPGQRRWSVVATDGTVAEPAAPAEGGISAALVIAGLAAVAVALAFAARAVMARRTPLPVKEHAR